MEGIIQWVLLSFMRWRCSLLTLPSSVVASKETSQGTNKSSCHYYFGWFLFYTTCNWPVPNLPRFPPGVAYHWCMCNNFLSLQIITYIVFLCEAKTCLVIKLKFDRCLLYLLFIKVEAVKVFLFRKDLVYLPYCSL